MHNFITYNPKHSIQSVRAIERRRIQAVTRRNVGELIAMIQVAMDKFVG